MSSEQTDSAPANHVDDEPQVAAEPGIKVFAGNLPFTTDEGALKALFAPIEDDIVSTVVIQRFGKSAGYGFVTVKTQEAADKAVSELDKKDVDGRAMIVEVARTNYARKDRRDRRYSGRRGRKPVPGEVTDAEANGQIVPVARIDDANAGREAEDGAGDVAPKPKKKKTYKRKPKTAPTGDAAAPNSVVNGTEGAITEGEAPGQGAVVKPRRPHRYYRPREHREHREHREPREPGEVRPRRQFRPRRERGEVPAGEPSKSVLFIANLAYTVDEEMLTNFFTEQGVNVKSARVVRRRWGTPRKSKGYGFVDVGDEAEQQKAIELANGQVIADREISVKVAVDARRVDEAVDKAEATENPENPTNAGNAALSVIPVTN